MEPAKHVWILALAIALYGIATGAILIAVPQACLDAGLSSGAIGLVGASGSAGYAAGCLAFGRLLRGASTRRVLLGGVGTTLGAALGLNAAGATPSFVACQMIFGMAGGAVWPFASAWMLEFQADGIARTRLLRFYNLAWTTGTALGMYLTGLLCRGGLVRETFTGAAGLLAAAFALALVPRSRRPAAGEPAAPAANAPRIGRSILLAAILANVTAVGTRSLILVNYPELNRALGFEADRMGLFTAATVLAMMAAFAFGTVYEPWLGLRRVYVVMAAALVSCLLAFAFVNHVAVLLAVAALSGLVNAVTFQGSILAATSHFAAAPRRGTTLHESIIGLGGLFPLAGGVLASELKAAGTAPLDALRSPFLALAGITAVALGAQVILVSRRTAARRLLPPADVARKG